MSVLAPTQHSLFWYSRLQLQPEDFHQHHPKWLEFQIPTFHLSTNLCPQLEPSLLLPLHIGLLLPPTIWMQKKKLLCLRNLNKSWDTSLLVLGVQQCYKMKSNCSFVIQQPTSICSSYSTKFVSSCPYMPFSSSISSPTPVPKDSLKTFGVVDFERIYCYLSVIHTNKDYHLTPMGMLVIPSSVPTLSWLYMMHTNVITIILGIYIIIHANNLP